MDGKIKVLGIGDNACDKYYPEMMMYPGGQAMNFAVYAKILGVDSTYMGVFGNDREAEFLLSILDKFGIDHSHCREYEGENCYTKVRLENGERKFIDCNHGGVALEHPLVLNGGTPGTSDGPDNDDLSYIKEFNLIHTGIFGHFDDQLRVVKKKTSVPISYDFSDRWNQEYYKENVLPYVDYAFISCEDMTEDEAKDACAGVAASGGDCKLVVATRGKRGAVAYDRERFYDVINPYNFQNQKLFESIVDTLGAGDAFATAFMLSYLKDQNVDKALEEGEKFAHKICNVRGAYGYGKSFTE